MKRTLQLLLLVSLCAVRLFAEKPPSIELGFNPDRVYDFGELDSVNLLNGNLIVQIPIGEPRYVNAGFSYGLTLVYNGKVWDYRRYYDSTRGDTYVYSEPNWRSNAGVGWRVSLGRLLPPSTPTQSSPSNESLVWVYESPSGDEHSFTPNIGENPDTATTQITGDRAHLRLIKNTSESRYVEFPNGDRHEFRKERGRCFLRRIDDRFGNNVTIDSVWRDPSNSANAREAGWILKDYESGSGTPLRTNYVDFLPASAVAQGSLEYNNNIDGGQLVSSIRLAKFGGGYSEYSFVYGAETVPWGCGHHPDPNDDDSLRGSVTTLPLLKKIILPDPEHTAFTFSYYTADAIGSDVNASIGAGLCGSGMLRSLQLPTFGTVSYEYQQYQLPETTCSDGAYEFINPGVKRKTMSDGRQWDYILTLGQPISLTPTEVAQIASGCGAGPEAPGIPPADVSVRPPRRWARTSVLGPAVDYLLPGGTTSLRRTRQDSYFYVWTRPGPSDPFAPTADPDSLTFGEPVTTGVPPANELLGPPCGLYDCGSADQSAADEAAPSTRRRLSTQFYEGCANDATGDCSSGRLMRSTYLRMPLPTGFLTGGGAVFEYAPESSKTVYHDDSGCSGVCWIKTTNSLKDGAGNYKQTLVETNFPEGGGYTSFTNYSDWLTGDAFSSRAWILGLYDRIDRTEGSSTATTDYCFEPTTGFLNATRVRKGGAGRTGEDLLARYKADAKGNLVSEKFYGGDDATLATNVACPAVGTLPAYNIFHTYQRGRRVKSEYCAPTTDENTCGSSILTTFDVTLDSTDAPTSSRNASQIQTNYSYDVYGRLQTITPPAALAKTAYTYSAAEWSGGAISRNPLITETAKDGTNVLATSTYEFDAFGRPWRLSKSLPNDKVSVVETVFDKQGRKKSISQPFERASHPTSVTTLYGTDWTQTIFDSFDRPLKITAPDSTVTSFSYTGDRKIVTTVDVATSASATTPVSRTEYYDAQRRLRRVEESGTNTSTTVPVGGTTITSYDYDVGGRLTHVSMTAGSVTQERAFNFDFRGFLTSEQHPESGSTSYSKYDAKGHARQRTDADGGIVSFAFDAAERPLRVCAGALPCDSGGIKEFTYGTGQLTTDLNGTLKTAVRRNNLPSVGQIDVTESYRYSTTTGLLSGRSTLVENVNGGTRSSINQFDYGIDEYDKFGKPTKLIMPTCTISSCGTSQGLTSVMYSRKAGFLTSVVDFANLGYHPSGMVAAVTHLSTPNVMDSYSTTNGMARPSRITFGGGASECPLPTASLISAPVSLCQGGSGTASVPTRSGISHTWRITGGTITSSTSGDSITFAASGTEQVVLTVRATNTCASYVETETTVATNGPPAQPSITAPSCVDTSGTASVAAVSGITHSWSIQGGTFISGSTGEVVTFQPNGTGAITLTVTATNACNTTATKSVTVSSSCGAPSASTISGPTTICGRSYGTASVSPRSGITHTWSITGGAITSLSTGESVTFRVDAIGTAVLTVTATNSSGSTASSIQIPIVPTPTATLEVRTSLPILRGAGAQLKVVLEGAGPWDLVWSDGLEETVSVSPHYRTVSPTTTTMYDLTSVTSPSFECAFLVLGSAQVTVVLPAPAWVKA
ncbi:MAG: hypothetical protein ACTHQM_11760, partial [Thermoanaerobaculia bacterium]